MGKWSTTDHIGHICTRYGMFIAQNISLTETRELRIQFGSYFYSIVKWLDYAFKSDYFSSMFYILLYDQRFNAIWEPHEVAEIRDRFVTEIESIKHKLPELIKTDDRKSIYDFFVNCAGCREDELEFENLDSTMIYCAWSMVMDQLDKISKNDLEDDPFEALDVAIFIGALFLICYRELKN